MEERNYAEFQEKLINEIVDVFERNDADVFDIFRVLSVMKEGCRQYLLQTIDETEGQLRSILEALEGGEEDDESEVEGGE